MAENQTGKKNISNQDINQLHNKANPKNRRLVIFFIITLIVTGLFIIYYEFFSLPQFVVTSLPEIVLPQKNQTVIVFAPHCDDEVLGAGGLIAKSIQNGAKVYVVLMTNGDGQFFGTLEEFRKIYPSANDYIKFGNLRQEETINALSVLGVTKENIVFLGYPDHGLKQLLITNWSKPYRSPYTKTAFSPYQNSYQNNAPYTGENLENNLDEILKKYSPNYIIVTSQSDIHPDHAATFDFVVKAMQTDNLNVNLWTYLIHYKFFPSPSGLKKDKYLTPPAKLINSIDGWHTLPLNNQTEDLKQSAIQQYKSQLKVPFLNNLLISFIRKNELFKVVY